MKKGTRHVHPEQIASEYSEEYDAYYDRVNNKWLEPKCGYPGCSFCDDRPEEPLNVDDLKKFDWGEATKKINKPE